MILVNFLKVEILSKQRFKGPYFAQIHLLLYLKCGMVNESNIIAPSWREGWTSLVSSHIGYLMDKKAIQIHIQNFNGT
jgi:hypothetical protein